MNQTVLTLEASNVTVVILIWESVDLPSVILIIVMWESVDLPEAAGARNGNSYYVCMFDASVSNDTLIRNKS